MYVNATEYRYVTAFEVIQGHWFRITQKRVCDFLLVININLAVKSKITNYIKKYTEITEPKSQTLCDKITK